MGTQRQEIVRPPVPKSLYMLLILLVCLNAGARVCWSSKHELYKPFSVMKPPQGKLVIEVVSDPYDTKFSTYSLVRIIESESEPTLTNSTLKLNWPSRYAAPHLGERYRVYAQSKKRGFGEFDRWLFDRGVRYEAKAKQVQYLGFAKNASGFILKLRKAALGQFDQIKINPQARALLEAILLGERSDNSLNEVSFRKSGLSHLLAVSGSHLSLLAGFVALLFGNVVGRKARIVMAVVVCVIFHVMSGAQDSSLRAILMLILGSFTLLGTRRTDPLHILGLGGSALIIQNPLLALSLGFQLSCAAIVGIYLLLPLVKAWFSSLLPYLPNFLVSALSMSLLGQISTVPLAVPVFSEISLVAPIANILAVPVMTAALYISVVGTCALPLLRPLGIILIKTSEIFLYLLIWIAESCADQRWAVIAPEGIELYISLACMLFFLTLYLWWPTPKVTREFVSNTRLLGYRLVSVSLFLMSLILALFPSLLDPDTYASKRLQGEPEGIYILDVGQGDATLIRSKDRVALIDTGGDKKLLKEELRKLNIRQVNTVYLTHMHDDHYGGAFGLKGFGVEELVVSKGSATSLKLREISEFLNARVREIQDDDIDFVGRFTVECFGPNTRVLDPEANESSLLLFIDEQKSQDSGIPSALITGDSESRASLVALYDEIPDVEVDVLKVGHHGSRLSLSRELLELLNPRLAVISCGKDNSYGHPRPEPLKLLNDLGIPYKRTDLQGTVYLGAN